MDFASLPPTEQLRRLRKPKRDVGISLNKINNKMLSFAAGRHRSLQRFDDVTFAAQ